MSVVVGTLTIDLKANTASFAQSMDKMSQLSARTANDVKRSLEKIAAVGLAMGAAIAGGTAEMIKKSVEAADAMGKLAQKTGTTAETLSVLGYAAKLADLDLETLGKGLEKLSQAMFKAQNGNVQMQRIFDRLGVSTKDANGHLRDSGLVMEDLAVKFSSMADGSGKTALAMAIFGKGGAAMIPMLNELGEKQAEINEEAHRFGLVLSTSTTQVAAEAHDKLKKLGAMFTGLGYSLMSATLPALNELTDKLIDIARSSDLPGLARAFGGEVVKAVHLLGDALDFAVRNAHALKLALEAIAAIKIASIAIPIVADLAGGGLANVGKGIDKATLGMLGFERAAKTLPKIGAGISGVASGFYGAAKGASFAEVAALGLETGFGKVGKAITSLSFASVFASITGGLGRMLAALKAVSAASIFAGLTSSLRAIPALFTGIATAALNASKALMLAALSNPWTLAALAIAGLVALLYKFRDSTITLGGETYKLRDTWNAAWLAMKDAVSVAVTFVKKRFDEITDAWTAVVNWIKNHPLAKPITDGLALVSGASLGERLANSITSRLHLSALGKKYLNEARSQRVAAGIPEGYTTGGDHPEGQDLRPTKSETDTSGLGKPQKDIVNDELRKLDLAIQQQKAYLGVLDATPEKIAAVAAEEKARGIILELTNKLIDEGRLKTGQSLPAAQQAAIRQRVAEEESLKSLVNYGKELVAQQRSAELHIQQTRALAAANLEGDAAVRQANIDNAILALRFNRVTGEVKAMTPELEKLRAEMTATSSIDAVAGLNKEIDGLRDELAQRKLITAATLDSIDAQRQAALASKLYRLDQNIQDQPVATAEDRAAMAALLGKRDALIQVAKAENDAADAQAALSLLSPVEQLDRERDSLNHAADALRKLQGGTLSYEQELGIMAREQDAFNRATDETVNLLLREGSLGDGVKAFFLKMQEQAKSAAATIYDVLNETFNKLSTNLTDLLTATNSQKRRDAINQFANMFADIGKNLLDSTIKTELQSGLGKLGKAFGITLPGNKPDGSSEDAALWVRWRMANPLSGQGVGGDASGIISGLLGGGAGEDGGGDAAAAGGGGSGLLGGLLGALGGIFGLHSPASPAATRSNAATSAFPARATGRANELETLASSAQPSSPQPTPSSPQPASTAALQFIPSLLRQSAAGAVLGASLLGAPAQAQQPTTTSPTTTSAQETVLPDTQPFWPQTAEAQPSSAQPSPSSPAAGLSSPEPGLSSPTPGPSSPTPAMSAASVAPIPNPPDVQPKTYTKITQIPPTLFHRILAAGVTLAGNIGGSMLGGMVPGASSASASSLAASGAWAQADQPDDNTPNGIVTRPVGYAGGGKVFGDGSGTSDSIPAMLSHGEYVIKASAVAKNLPLLHNINNDKLPMRFATGGLVGYDDGGLVSPNMAYTPGERGIGSMSGVADQTATTIQSSTPSNTGDSHTWHIDARGNPDPAQSIAQTARMMKTAAPQIAAAAVHAIKDQQLRRAPSAR